MSQSASSGKWALLVDDDLSSRRLLVRILEPKGFKCSSAASVAEARGLLAHQNYILVITDMRMWQEEGIELVRFVTDEYQGTAVIMVSGQTDEGLEKRAIQAGVSFFIRKPVDVEDLLEKVETALEEKAKEEALRRHQRS